MSDILMRPLNFRPKVVKPIEKTKISHFIQYAQKLDELRSYDDTINGGTDGLIT